MADRQSPAEASSLERWPLVGAVARSWRRRGQESHAINTRTAAIADELTKLRADLAGLTHVSSTLEARLVAVQALTARIYERQAGWTDELAALRQEPDYEDAWETEPLITVRVATYNNAEILVDRTLASLRRQGYERWEAIVVGDHCTDDTSARVAALKDPRIRFENLSQRGAYPSAELANWYVAGTAPVNRSLELASGRWIAALDHDDEWDEDHLEVLLEEARRTRAEVIHGQWRVVEASSGRLLNGTFGGGSPPTLGRFTFQATLCHGKLSRFHYDLNAHLADEPGDWNRARRLWDAGVRFAALDRPVATIWFAPKTEHARRWLRDMIGERGYLDLPSSV